MIDDASQRRTEREVELLSLENRALRAHLAGTGSGDRIAGPDDAIISKTELEELRRAHKDLRWLVARLANSPARRLFRTRSGFKRLEEEWGE